MSCDDEADLIRQAAAGDRAALAQLLLVHYDAVRRHIAARISDELKPLVSAEDILHQTFVRAAQHIGGYETRGQGAFRGWLKTIAENLLKDAEKRRRRERRCATQAPPQGADASRSWAALVEKVAGDSSTASVKGQRQENARRLHAAMAMLPEDQREVLERYYLRQQSLDEIARDLGTSKDAVRGICYRGRKNLRAAMGRSSLYFSG